MLKPTRALATKGGMSTKSLTKILKKTCRKNESMWGLFFIILSFKIRSTFPFLTKKYPIYSRE